MVNTKWLGLIHITLLQCPVHSHVHAQGRERRQWYQEGWYSLAHASCPDMLDKYQQYLSRIADIILKVLLHKMPNENACVTTWMMHSEVLMQKIIDVITGAPAVALFNFVSCCITFTIFLLIIIMVDFLLLPTYNNFALAIYFFVITLKTILALQNKSDALKIFCWSTRCGFNKHAGHIYNLTLSLPQTLSLSPTLKRCMGKLWKQVCPHTLWAATDLNNVLATELTGSKSSR